MKVNNHFLFAVGIVGIVISTIAVFRATVKATKLVEDVKGEISPENENVADDSLYYKLDVEAVKLYVPAVVLGTFSLISVIFSYNNVNKGFNKYRSRVTNRFGEQIDGLLQTMDLSRGDLFLEKDDAEEILHHMRELIKNNGAARLSDLFDMRGLFSSENDYRIGWKDLKDAKILCIKDGYLLKMPKTIPLN